MAARKAPSKPSASQGEMEAMAGLFSALGGRDAVDDYSIARLTFVNGCESSGLQMLEHYPVFHPSKHKGLLSQTLKRLTDMSAAEFDVVLTEATAKVQS